MSQHDLSDLNTAVFGNREQQVPGLKKEVMIINETLNGNGKEPGLLQKVGTMWRIHVWLLCGFSTALGSMITLIVQQYIKK